MISKPLSVFMVYLITNLEALHPNIVIIIADDLGWDDVSFHGSNQILTPNIDLLAYSGVSLGRYYSHCVCTPSRSALLTGKYAYTLVMKRARLSPDVKRKRLPITIAAVPRTYRNNRRQVYYHCNSAHYPETFDVTSHQPGMQGYPLTYGEDRGLPLSQKILPEYLKEHGYATHLVGKWHVGHARTEYLPTMRGFDSHFGHRGGFLDYYEYITQEQWNTSRVSGLDLYRNLTADWNTQGYITDVYNEEAMAIIKRHDASTPLFLMLSHNAPHSGNDNALLQAPPEEVKAQRHVDLPERRYYAAMVKKLDDSVGDVVNTLLEKEMLENTIIVFMSDNGGMTLGNSLNYASNWPLRGIKMSPFEGGIRVSALLWSSKLNVSHHYWNGYIHVSDWMPTLLAATGINVPLETDGKNLWDNIKQNVESIRDEIFEIDDFTGFAAIIQGDYKLITGHIIKEYSNYLGDDLREMIGEGPLYDDVLKNSKTYNALSAIGKQLDVNKENLRNLRKELIVKCIKERNRENLCQPAKDKYCLYNIKEDPCETTDISSDNPDIVTRLQSRLALEIRRTIPRVVPLYRDPRSRPSLHNYTWTTWADGVSA